MSNIIDEFGAYMLGNKGSGQKTVKKYVADLRRLERWLESHDYQLLDAEQSDLEAFVNHYLWHDLKLSSAGRKPVIAAIRSFFTYCFGRGLLRFNPAKNLEYPKLGNSLPIVVSLKSIEAILQQPDLTTFIGLRDATILHLLIGCGLRIDGVAGLNLEDIIAYQDDQGRDRWAISPTEKGEVERRIPVPLEAHLLLKAYLAHPDLAAIDRRTTKGQRVLFISVRNRTIPQCDYVGEHRRISTRSIDDMIKDYGTLAGVPRAEQHAHAFRHRYGTELAESKVDLATIQVMMGHASIESTRIYLHLAIESKTKEADRAGPLAKIKSPVSALLHHLTNPNKSPR